MIGRLEGRLRAAERGQRLTDLVERRGSPRRSVDISIQVQVGENSTTARLKSLSRLGALLEMDRMYPIGTPLRLCVELPEMTGELGAFGQIIRVTSQGGIHSVAILFAPLSPAMLARIDAILNR